MPNRRIVLSSTGQKYYKPPAVTYTCNQCQQTFQSLKEVQNHSMKGHNGA